MKHALLRESEGSEEDLKSQSIVNRSQIGLRAGANQGERVMRCLRRRLWTYKLCWRRSFLEEMKSARRLGTRELSMGRPACQTVSLYVSLKQFQRVSEPA